MFNWLKDQISSLLICYLMSPVKKYEPFSVSSTKSLYAILNPGDVLLVEGNQRFSVAVKYLTQSTWSHAAMFVGVLPSKQDKSKMQPMLIEADLKNGVQLVRLSKYEGFNTRICRPAGITAGDLNKVINFMLESIGLGYDLKNVIDLARYLIPTPPVPVRFRRGMLTLGSGDPTRVICSTRIAQAFQSVRYPILPQTCETEECQNWLQKILQIRHHSLFAPRDYDLSPYFTIIKPAIEKSFDYKSLIWSDDKRLPFNKTEYLAKN